MDPAGSVLRSSPHVTDDLNMSGGLDDDELDALLAEEVQTDPNAGSLFGIGLHTVHKPKPPEDDYADDMEAMADMGHTW